jgi:FkbM family methyltransferase
LERKFAGSTNWLPDPQLWRKKQYNCKNITDLGTSGEHHVCLDNWEKHLNKKDGAPPCIVYDLGIRAQPMFGQYMMRDYGCAVRAYDPSDTSAKWWESKEAAPLRAAGEGRYKFHKMAAGGQDGPLELFEYNWQQVSIVKEEHDHTRPNWNKEKFHEQKSFHVQAKTFPTMLQEHGDTKINVLKVDIEGSEYMLMQDIFDRMGCPPVGQITMEYHHFSVDDRYGSSPEINTIHNLLNACGFKSFMVRDHWKNFVTPEDDFYVSPKRYTLASYCKDCVPEM